MSVIDTATNTVIDTIGVPVPTEREPWEVIFGVAPETITLSPDPRRPRGHDSGEVSIDELVTTISIETTTVPLGRSD